MAMVAMRKIEVEYLTAAAGPTSHSPPPIDVAAMIAPGPMTLNRFRALNGGGATRSAVSQHGSSPWSGGMNGLFMRRRYPTSGSSLQTGQKSGRVARDALAQACGFEDVHPRPEAHHDETGFVLAIESDPERDPVRAFLVGRIRHD